VIHAYRQMGVPLERHQANRLLPMIRAFVSVHKRTPESAELNQFLHSL